jgi:hypothetical protein
MRARGIPRIAVISGIVGLALTGGGCGSSAYTSIRPGDNETYYLTRTRQIFSVTTSELLWCEPVPPQGNLRCRVVGE